jgi:guanylate kinase
MKTPGKRPLLMVVSGPSGSGKSTLCDRLVSSHDRLRYSVSCTTRDPRPGEEDGRDYRFLSAEAFEERRAAGAFLESAVVHGRAYGTLKEAVLAPLEAGDDVIMDIDVQGAAQVRDRASRDRDGPLGRAFFDVFVLPPSRAELERRLRARGQDAEETMARRLRAAEQELAAAVDYRYALVNDRIDEAVAVLESILVAERHRLTGGEDVHVG